VAAERFWIEGLGLEVLWRSDHEDGGEHDLLVVGWPSAGWHLELVDDREGRSPPSPTEEDLLVLYLGGPLDEVVEQRLITAGGTRVAARNPYWDHWGGDDQGPRRLPPRAESLHLELSWFQAAARKGIA
jgi:hypothetical protein